MAATTASQASTMTFLTIMRNLICFFFHRLFHYSVSHSRLLSHTFLSLSLSFPYTHKFFNFLCRCPKNLEKVDDTCSLYGTIAHQKQPERVRVRSHANSLVFFQHKHTHLNEHRDNLVSFFFVDRNKKTTSSSINNKQINNHIIMLVIERITKRMYEKQQKSHK